MTEIPEQGVFSTPTGQHWVEDGILFSVAANKIFMTIDDARSITETFQQLSQKPLPLLVDFNTSTGQSSEARNYFASDPVHIETYSAVALLVSNPVAKVIANIYMGLVKPLKPTRLFTDRDQALAWLDQFKEA